MNLAKCELAIYPHCGEKKKILRLISGNTFNAVQWSDAKMVAPMMPEVSPIQKCPECGHFYFTFDVNKEEGDDYTMECGWLNFEDAIKAKDELNWKEANWEYSMAIIILWAYNDIIRSGEKTSKKQYEVFKNAISSMLNLSILENNPLLRSEMYREIGEFDKCIEILQNLDLKDKHLEFIAKQIALKAAEKDCKVFKIQKLDEDDSTTNNEPKERKKIKPIKYGVILLSVLLLAVIIILSLWL